jgi:hypothetical protein
MWAGWEARGGLRDRSLPVSDACIRSFLVDEDQIAKLLRDAPNAGTDAGKAAAVPKYPLTEMFETRAGAAIWKSRGCLRANQFRLLLPIRRV